MTEIKRGFSGIVHYVTQIGDCTPEDQLYITISDANVGGIGIVTATWATAFAHVMDGQHRLMPAGSIDLNAADVASPTTYYVYFKDVSGVTTATVSTTNPAIDPAVDEYFTTNIVRFKSVGGTVTYYATKYPSQDGIYEVIHNLKENVQFANPVWISGCTPTLAAGGKLSTTSGYSRFVGNEPRTESAITDGTLIDEGESNTYVGLDNVVTYADGTAVTANKFFKVLVGIKRDKQGILGAKLYVVRQGKPAVEYTTRAEALNDAEGKAATGFGSNYLGHVLPLCYIVTQMGAGATSDYTQGGAYPAGDLIDLRETGIIGGGGGGSTVTDHGALAGLGDDDHPHYLLADGSRALSGDWNAGAKSITTTSTLSGSQLISTVAIGTKPLDVTSTTVCTNLNADTVDGIEGASILLKDGTVAMTGALDMGAKGITNAAGVATTTVTASGLAKALTFESTQAAGTAPFVVASDTVVANLNASKLEGNAASAFAVTAKGVTNGDTHDHAGGDGAQIDHGGLDGLADDDHTQYLLADGSRNLTGNLTVSGGVTIDGVDISAHAANANAHHNAVTLGANTSGILSLSTQAISMATTVAESYVLAGPTHGTGGTAAPTFRAINTCDVKSGEGTLVLADGTNNDVALQDGVDQYTVSGPTAAFTITGFANGHAGRRIVILNPIAKAMTAAHQSADSVAANRIICPGAYADTATSGTGLMVFEYFGTTQRWVMISLIS